MHDPSDTWLARFHREGRELHGELGLGFELYRRTALERTSARLARSRPHDAHATDALAQMLPRICGADLYLALACEQGSPRAWAALRTAVEPSLLRVARAQAIQGTPPVELVEDLLGDLALPARDAVSRRLISTYDATGRLAAWLAAILARRIADLRRARERETGELARRASEPDAEDPLELALRGEEGLRLQRAFAAAWRDLTPREAWVCLAKFHDGWPQARVARVLGVSEPRVTQLVQAALAKLRERVASEFGADEPKGPLLQEVIAAVLARVRREPAALDLPPVGESR